MGEQSQAMNIQEEEDAVASFVQIDQSPINIHTWTEKGFALPSLIQYEHVSSINNR